VTAQPTATPAAWTDLLAAALIGTARGGGQPDALLDAAAAHALRRRAGVALTPHARPPAPAGPDTVPTVGPAAAARADDLLAFDRAPRDAGPLRDPAARLDVLTEWLAAAARSGRRVPPELVPALLDAGRRHRALRPLIAEAAGPLAGWLAGQRADWSYASATPPVVSTVDDTRAWDLGSTADRVRYLSRLRRGDPAAARDLLVGGWAAEPPADRAALLNTLATDLSADDEPLLEQALDDRRGEVRTVALDLLGRLPDSGYGRRMADRADACVDLSRDDRVDVTPPAACDRPMRRDGIAARPPAGVGERAWWLEEILARTPLRHWPAPAALLVRPVSRAWAAALYRGLARAAATQRDRAWAAALGDRLTTDVVAGGGPDDRLLLEALYAALPPDDLAERATAALRRGLADATAVGVEQILGLCPGPWPPALADAVFGALDDQHTRWSTGWRLTGLCEIAARRLPAALAPRAVAVAERLRASRPHDAGVTAVERLAATLRYRHDMLRELA
jgi:hypothetical protein